MWDEEESNPQYMIHAYDTVELDGVITIRFKASSGAEEITFEGSSFALEDDSYEEIGEGKYTPAILAASSEGYTVRAKVSSNTQIEILNVTVDGSDFELPMISTKDKLFVKLSGFSD
jgi:hypothetical protein